MTPLVIALIWSGLWLAVAVALSIVWGGRRRVVEQVGESERMRVEAMKKRHGELKELVARAERDEQRSLQIYGVAKSLAEALSWKDMAPRLSQGIQKIFDAHEFLLYALDESGRWTQLLRRGNWTKEPPIADIANVVGGAFHPPQVQELAPVYVVPISNDVDGQLKRSGVLFLKSDKPLAVDIKEAAEEFAAQLGVALAKALLFNRMEMHSLHDGLTGALRRQPFMDRINEELKKAAVFHTSFSLLMVDIDHFKSVNDTHGHAAGDAVLARVGELLHESFYETDVVGRYGGEEFVVLLPRAESAGVLRKAEALRHRFEVDVIPSGFENLRITVSVGLAHYPQNGRSAEELIASADRALYHAKETGRNRVVAA